MEDPTNYRRKYEDALERAKEELGSGCFNKGSIEYIFPELKESEGERIRKVIMKLVDVHDENSYHFDRFSKEKCIAWLEKQGEQKPADKVEQKFKVGDWVVEGYCQNHIDHQECQSIGRYKDPFCILDYDARYGYKYGDWHGTQFWSTVGYANKYWHLWTIQDAKDGDVLQLGKVTAIFKKYIGNGNCKCYCSVYDGEFEIPNTDNSYGCHNAVPATKEQRDILFQKMHKAGYEWDDEKKETKLLISNGGDFEPELSHKEVTKKSEQDEPINWTEEDEKLLNGIYNTLEGIAPLSYEKELDWLKSIKERLQ